MCADWSLPSGRTILRCASERIRSCTYSLLNSVQAWSVTRTSECIILAVIGLFSPMSGPKFSPHKKVPRPTLYGVFYGS